MLQFGYFVQHSLAGRVRRRECSMTQWTVSHHGHFVFLTPGNDSMLNGPLLQVIKHLVTGQPTFIGEAPDFFQIFGGGR